MQYQSSLNDDDSKRTEFEISENKIQFHSKCNFITENLHLFNLIK